MKQEETRNNYRNSIQN